MKLAIIVSLGIIMVGVPARVGARHSAALSSVGMSNVRLPEGDEYVSVIQRRSAADSAASTGEDVFKIPPLPTKRTKTTKMPLPGSAEITKALIEGAAKARKGRGSESEEDAWTDTDRSD